MLTGFFKFMEGLWAGTGAELDPIVIAGDVIGTIFLTPISIVTKRKAAVLGKLGRLGRLLRAGGTANSTMARILAQQAERTVLGISDIQRVRKIAELATAGVFVVTAIAGLIQGMADQGESVDHLEAILANAENPEDAAVALSELQNETGSTDDFRLILTALGEPVDDLDNTTPAGGLYLTLQAVPRLVIPFSRAMARGMETATRVARATRGVASPRTVAPLITRYARTDAPAIFAGLKALEDIGVQNLGRLPRQLASHAPNGRKGARFVLQTLLRKAKSGQTVRVEQFVRLNVAGVGRPLRRFYDFVLNGVRYEVKNWSFTPTVSNQSRAVRAANEQWIRDLADIANNSGVREVVNQLRWVFPKALSASRVRAHFQDILREPAVRAKLLRYLNGNVRLLRDLQTQVGRDIDTIVEFL